MRGDELQVRVTIKHATIDNARKCQSAVGGPEDFLMERIFVPVCLARRVGGMKKQRLARGRQRIPERLELGLIEIFSRQIGRHYDAVHLEILVAPLQLRHAVVHIDHRQAGECFETMRIFRMSVGKGVIEDFAELQSFGRVTSLLNSPAGIGEDTDVDAVLIHDVEILPVIESVKAHPSNVILRFGYKIEEFTGKRVKVSIDDHGLPFLALVIDYLYLRAISSKNFSASSSWRKLRSTNCSGLALLACVICGADMSIRFCMPLIVG